MYDNGQGVAKDQVEAVKWYRKAAEQGFAFAQFNLGLMYGNGQGVPKNQVEAIIWYRKAAGQGYADAQNLLGVIYEDGRGVPKDRVEAVKWYTLAAELGKGETKKDAMGWLDEISKKMTPAQLEKSQRLVREWFQKYRGGKK